MAAEEVNLELLNQGKELVFPLVVLALMPTLAIMVPQTLEAVAVLDGDLVLDAVVLVVLVLL